MWHNCLVAVKRRCQDVRVAHSNARPLDKKGATFWPSCMW